ncbi:uncharacterized protein At2g39795, mitochondrial-like isoform X1 [Mangifera indica]|uniref:uncharacterized protein At2g39795, mitochondrial-like isoform X1 n=1 Tax=Mangifera indica TaxID=29780 RepID=UPI001CFA0B88|nr:uncharacterized protein At2g39795, mitochondrial-like isoform X1 [Mangifera indica]
MAGLIRSLKRTQLLYTTVLPNPTRQNKALFILNLNPTSQTTIRNYISEMRKSAIEGNILRLLRSEIQYELERSPPKQPWLCNGVHSFRPMTPVRIMGESMKMMGLMVCQMPIAKFNSFTVDEQSGDQWIRLNRRFGENEDIKVEATMFDGCIPFSKDGVAAGEDVKLHISLIVNISKGDGDVLEFMCSAWPDTIEITKLFIRDDNKMSAQPYVGPEFKELDDELQDSLYTYLEERGIDEQLAIFLHEYIRNKEKTEFIGWMQSVKSYIEKK